MRDGQSSESDRGQIYTIEGTVAAILLLVAVFFALQATAATPTSGAGEEVTAKQAVAEDALVAIDNAENESLSYLVRYWVPKIETEDGRTIGPGFEAGVYENTSVKPILGSTFTNRSFEYNLYVDYYNETTEKIETEPIRVAGQPDDSAVTATRSVALFDDDELTGPANETGYTVSDEEADFYVDDAETDSIVFGVVEVRLVVW